jgi:hypothetical protein
VRNIVRGDLQNDRVADIPRGHAGFRHRMNQPLADPRYAVSLQQAFRIEFTDDGP